MHVRYLLANVLGAGGTIATTIATANRLAARGHDVEIASVVRRKGEGTFAIDPSVRVRFLTDARPGQPDRDDPARKAPSALVPADETRAYLFSELTDVRLRNYLSEVTGIVIATRPALNLLLAEFGRRECVRIGMEHLNLPRQREASHEFQLPLMRQWYPHLDAFVTLTTADADDFREFVPGLRVTTISNASKTVNLGLSSATTHPIVISAGRLATQKGFDRLIPAFARVGPQFPDWQLHIYGSGAAKDNLQAAIDRTGSGHQIRLMGFTPTLPQTLADAGVFAMTSLFEGQPMVMLEAMGVGLPVVSYDFHSGPRDLVVPGENGFLVADGDETGFAAALARLMADPELRVRMGRRSREIAQHFRPEAITIEWEALFADLAARHHPPLTGS